MNISGIHYEHWRLAPWEPERWPNFSPHELACKCNRYCEGSYFHDPAFVDGLQAVRYEVGRVVKINSGHRCPQWNAACRGAPMSTHKRIAADIAVSGEREARELLEAAMRAKFTGYGLHRAFLHVDRRERPASWDYGPASRRFWARALEGRNWKALLRSLD